MDVLLVVPINRSYVVMPSLGLGYLAAVAREQGHRVTLLNTLKEGMSHQDFERYVEKHHHDLIGFQLFSYDIDSVRSHLASVRRASPKSLTVAGGAHPSGDPQGTLDLLPDLDYAFQGEAEIGFPRLLSSLETGSPALPEIPGLIYRADSTTRSVPPECVQQLDSLPYPAWDLARPESYPEAPHGAFTKQFPTAPVIFTRGCPFACTFCAGRSITGPKLRKRSIDNILGELHLLRDRGIREFHVEDENFTAHRKLVIEFCERIRTERLGMSWSLPAGVRIDCLDREMLEAMESAGCYSLALGIEFGSRRMLELTRKRLTLALIRSKMTCFRGLNIKTTGFFLLGIPGETIAEMKKTIDFALELPVDRAQFNNFMPLPGSEIWDQLQAAGKLDSLDWSRLFVHDVAYCSDGIRPQDLKNLQRTAYLRFYLRPRTLARLLAEVRSWRHLRFLLRRFVDALS